MLHDLIHELIGAWQGMQELGDDNTGQYRALAVGAKQELPCEALGLYILDPRVGAYRQVGLVGYTSYSPLPPTIPAMPQRAGDQELQQLLAQAVGPSPSWRTPIQTFNQRSKEWLLVGLRYKQTVYSFIAVRTRETCSQQEINSAIMLSELAFMTLQNSAARAALRAHELPLDVTADDADFYNQLRNFIVTATGMQLVLLRTRGALGTSENRNLTTVVMHGWDRPLQDFDITSYERFPLFQKAIAGGRPLFRPDPSNEEVISVWVDYPALRAFESFAIFPIEDDANNVIALLTVGSRCHIDFTPVLESITKGIARSVGLTLRNRELYFEQTELQSDAIETASALDALEVYSDLTHQMGNAMSTIPEVVEALDTLGRRQKEISLKELLGKDYLGAIEESRDTISALISQATGITSPAEDEIKRTKISEIWDEAIKLVQFRLHKYKISVVRTGDIALEAYPLQLRQVFFHLLLNSISAFSSRSRRDNRKVELIVHRNPPSADYVLVRYTDNAGGINPATLRRKEAHSQAEPLPALEQAIFLRGVTSRTNGSGNGLWVVRHILQRHHGSIRLVSHRDGVVFDIELPTSLHKLITARRGT
jgi:signal transduction histidine kinase